MKKKHKIRTDKSFLKKVYSKTRKFILKCKSRYTSKIMDRSTRVKSAEHDKISKTTSVSNLNAFSNNFLKSKVNDTFHISNFTFQNVISLTVILKIVYLRPFKNFTDLFGYASEQGKLSAVKKTKQ